MNHYSQFKCYMKGYWSQMWTHIEHLDAFVQEMYCIHLPIIVAHASNVGIEFVFCPDLFCKRIIIIFFSENNSVSNDKDRQCFQKWTRTSKNGCTDAPSHLHSFSVEHDTEVHFKNLLEFKLFIPSKWNVNVYSMNAVTEILASLVFFAVSLKNLMKLGASI